MEEWEVYKKQEIEREKIEAKHEIASKSLEQKQKQFEQRMLEKSQENDRRSDKKEREMIAKQEIISSNASHDLEKLEITQEQRVELMAVGFDYYVKKQEIAEQQNIFAHNREVEATKNRMVLSNDLLSEEMKLSHFLSEEAYNNAHDKEVDILNLQETYKTHYMSLEYQEKAFMAKLAEKLSVKEYTAKKLVDYQLDKLKREDILEESKKYQNSFKDDFFN